MLEADARKTLACNNRKASDRMAASEGETTMGRLGGRTGRRISNKSLYWFDADADWADDWYNNRMQHAMDAALDGEVMCWPTELDNWPVCERCGNDSRERKVTVELNVHGKTITCAFGAESCYNLARPRTEKAGVAPRQPSSLLYSEACLALACFLAEAHSPIG